jgi:serine/threonine protein kinase
MILIVGIAMGMLYLRVNRIRHRDLTPANVLLEEGEKYLRPIISDFGLSKEIEVGQSMGETVEIGTEAYRAPEFNQTNGNGKEITWAVDSYSFGMLLFRILSGIPEKDWGVGYRGNIELVPVKFQKLIEELWHQHPYERPDFTTVLERILPVSSIDAISRGNKGRNGGKIRAEMAGKQKQKWQQQDRNGGEIRPEMAGK